MKRKIKAALSGWYVWIFPLFAIIITGILLRQHFEHKGIDITISFEDAFGIQPEKTRVRFRGVVIGRVTDVTISDDLKDVIAHVNLEKNAHDFAVKGSKYALVVPKVNFKGISGLETFIEGTYISVQPGPIQAEMETEFKGQIGKEVGESVEDTVPYHLQTENLGSVSVGDSVNFRGMKIGSVTKLNLSKDARYVLVQINIQNRFAKLVRTNTRFWRKSAVQAKLGLFDSEIKVGSLDSLLNGGIEIATPSIPGEMAKAGTEFSLALAPPKDFEKWSPVLRFD